MNDGDDELEPWVLDIVWTHRSRSSVYSQFPGYTMAFALSVIKLYSDQHGFPVHHSVLLQVMEYGHRRESIRALHRLEDDGYVRLDTTRCYVEEITRYPYVVRRPEFAQENLKHALSRHPSLFAGLEEGQAGPGDGERRGDD